MKITTIIERAKISFLANYILRNKFPLKGKKAKFILKKLILKAKTKEEAFQISRRLFAFLLAQQLKEKKKKIKISYFAEEMLEFDVYLINNYVSLVNITQITDSIIYELRLKYSRIESRYGDLSENIEKNNQYCLDFFENITSRFSKKDKKKESINYLRENLRLVSERYQKLLEVFYYQKIQIEAIKKEV